MKSNGNKKPSGKSWSADWPDDVFTTLEKSLTADGYVWKGVVPGTCTWKRLEESQAIANFQNTLLEDVDSRCNLVSDVAAIKADIVAKCEKPESWSARVGIVVGAPGVGKSTSIKKFLDENGQKHKVVLCVPYKQLLTEVFSGRVDVYLTDDLFTRPVTYGTYKTMFVDEVTRIHMCEILVLAGILGVRNVVCFGDPAQGLNYKSGSMVHYNFPVIAECHSSKRFGKATADLLNKCSGTRVQGNPAVQDSWSFEELIGKIQDMSTVLVATEASRLEVAKDGVDAHLWNDVQGQTFDVVTVILYDEYDDAAICNPSIRQVLLSRARKGGVIKCGPNITARFANGDFGSDDGGKRTTGNTLTDGR